MSNDKPETVDQYTQTTIHCYPHLLDSENQVATVVSNRGCQTIASVDPARTNDDLYAKLEYTPYQSIAEGAVKELDLPRKAQLQWRLTESSATMRTRGDSDAPRSALKRSFSSTKRLSAFMSSRNMSIRVEKKTSDKEVQTTLSVMPHVLNLDEVANVYAEMSIQTSITCTPNESITKIIPRLKANISHTTEASVATQVSHTLGGFLTDDLDEDDEEKIISISELTQAPPEESEEPEPPSPRPPPPLVQRQDVTTVTTQATCTCGRKLLQEIASQLRVDSSTVQLTPVVFPPETPFGDRMVQVLNTTIALLQTEIANMMQAYIEEQTPSCPCTGNDDAAMLSNVCMCSGGPQNSCTCSRNVCGASVPRSANKEVSKYSRTREVVSPGSSRTRRVQEEIVEETTRVVTRGNIVQERVVRTIRPKSPQVTSGAMPLTCSGFEGPMSRLTETGEASEADAVEELPFDTSNVQQVQCVACGCLPRDKTVSSPLDSALEQDAAPLLPDYPERMLYKSASATPSTASTNTAKFEFLLQGANEDDAVSGDSAIVEGAGVSSNDAPEAGSSLPDIREQVIRLSVMYKSSSSQREPLLERVVRVDTPLPACSSKRSTNKPPSPTLSGTSPRADQTTSTPSAMPCPADGCPGRAGTPSTSTHASANVRLIIRYTTPPDEVVAGDEEGTRSFLYETEVDYGEPYMDALLEGDRDETEDEEEGPAPEEEKEEEVAVVDDMEAASRMILPWEELAIPEPGSYFIETLPPNTRQRWTQKDPVMVVEQAVEVDEPILAEFTEDVSTEGYGEEEGEETDMEAGASLEPTPSRRKQSLLYQKSAFKRNEPYMESLYRQFPDSEDDDEACGSKTEIPWKDILLPEKCRIRKKKKAQKCICKKGATPTPPYAVLPRGKSCGSMDAVKAMQDGATARATVSMPQIGGADPTITATVRLKQADAVVTKQLQLKPGENVMNLTVDDHAVNLHLQLIPPASSRPVTPSQTVPKPPEEAPAAEVAGEAEAGGAEAAGAEAVEAVVAGAEAAGVAKAAGGAEGEGGVVPKEGAPAPRAIASPTPGECFVPPRCPCKDKVIVDPIKPDPVIAALEAYEAEMKPLKQTLAELQNKIRSLNMPELKGCVCSIALEDAERAAAAVEVSPLSGYSRCVYYQRGAFHPLPELPYGRLPPPVLPSRVQHYDYSTAKGCYCGRCSERAGGSAPANPNYTYYSTSYPQEDLASKAMQHGAYPDHRGRNNPDRKAAYEECCKQPKSARGTRDKGKARTPVSTHSSRNFTSDSEDESRSSGHRRRKDKLDRQGKSRCPCQEATPIRDGQALRTNVDDFLPKSESRNVEAKRSSLHKATSRSKSKVTVRVRASRGTSHTGCSKC